MRLIEALAELAGKLRVDDVEVIPSDTLLDGSLDVAGTLVGECRVIVAQAIATETDRLWRAHRDLHKAHPDAPMPSRERVRVPRM